jgi:Rod binding domain-containing protein
LTVDPTTLSSLGAGLPPVDQSALPADVRKGTKTEKQTYAAALGFERMLVGELTKSMLQTASADNSSDSSSDSGDGSSASPSPDATTTMYQQMLPDQLADAVTSAGGIGLAGQLYKSLKGPAK